MPLHLTVLCSECHEITCTYKEQIANDDIYYCSPDTKLRDEGQTAEALQTGEQIVRTHNTGLAVKLHTLRDDESIATLPMISGQEHVYLGLRACQ